MGLDIIFGIYGIVLYMWLIFLEIGFKFFINCDVVNVCKLFLFVILINRNKE